MNLSLILSLALILQTPAPDEAVAAVSLRGGFALPKTWRLGVPLELSAEKSIAGKLSKSFFWEIEPAWVDQYSKRSEDKLTVQMATGTLPKTVKITLTVAKGDTIAKTVETIEFIPNLDEPGIVVPVPVPPAPLVIPNLRVMILYDGAQNITASQQATLFSTTIVAPWLNQNCMKDPNGRAAFRFWDKTVNVAGDTLAWQSAMKIALADKTPLPKILIFNDTTLVETHTLVSEQDTLTWLMSKKGK